MSIEAGVFSCHCTTISVDGVCCLLVSDEEAGRTQPPLTLDSAMRKQEAWTTAGRCECLSIVQSDVFGYDNT